MYMYNQYTSSVIHVIAHYLTVKDLNKQVGTYNTCMKKHIWWT